MTITLPLQPQEEAKLLAVAQAKGLSAGALVREALEKYLTEAAVESPSSESGEPASGMVEEDGLLVYRTGNPLPASVINDAIRRSREERSLHLTGDLP